MNLRMLHNSNSLRPQIASLKLAMTAFLGHCEAIKVAEAISKLLC